MIDQSIIHNIESTQNSLIKQIKVLQTPGVKSAKLRSETGLALIEGIHLVQAWISSESLTNIQTVIFSEQSINNEEIKEIVDYISSLNASSKGARINLVQVGSNLANELSQLEESPFLLGIIKTPLKQSLTECLENVVILDGIQDSGNAGTILRTAAAAGYKNVVCLKGSAQVWSPKVLRAAMGAHTALTIWDSVDVDELLITIKIPLIAARLDDSANLYEISELLRQPHAWVFGNEGAGVDAELLAIAKGVIVPQDPCVESLNVSAATAICLFEMRRVRRESQD